MAGWDGNTGFSYRERQEFGQSFARIAEVLPLMFRPCWHRWQEAPGPPATLTVYDCHGGVSLQLARAGPDRIRGEAAGHERMVVCIEAARSIAEAIDASGLSPFDRTPARPRLHLVKAGRRKAGPPPTSVLLNPDRKAAPGRRAATEAGQRVADGPRHDPAADLADGRCRNKRLALVMAVSTKGSPGVTPRARIRLLHCRLTVRPSRLPARPPATTFGAPASSAP